MQEVRKTDGDIFETLYREHYRRIYLFVFSVCKNAEVAEDITQDTFVKAFVSLPNDNTNTLHWLYKVANNLAMDRFRENRRYGQMPQEDAPSDFSTAEQFIRDEQYRQLYKAVAALPELDAKIITLYYFCGLSQREIAAVTGLSFTNVRVRFSRTREKLKEILTQV